MGKRGGADKERTGLAAACGVARITSSSSILPVRKARWALTAAGLLFLGQGLGKALDPTGYMAALDAFHVLKPAALSPLKLGALALVWTVVELLAGVALLYGGLSRAPAKQLVLGGVLLALGVTTAYLALDAGALVRHVPIQSCACFGVFLPQRLSAFVLVQEAAVLGVLGWLFLRVLRWPSLEHVAPMRPRALSHA